MSRIIVKRRGAKHSTENVPDQDSIYSFKCNYCGSTLCNRESGRITCLDCGIVFNCPTEDTSIQFDADGQTNSIFINTATSGISSTLYSSIMRNRYHNNYKEKQILKIYYELTSSNEKESITLPETVIQHCIACFNDIIQIGKTQRGKNARFRLYGITYLSARHNGLTIFIRDIMNKYNISRKEVTHGISSALKFCRNNKMNLAINLEMMKYKSIINRVLSFLSASEINIGQLPDTLEPIFTEYYEDIVHKHKMIKISNKIPPNNPVTYSLGLIYAYFYKKKMTVLIDYISRNRRCRAKCVAFRESSIRTKLGVSETNTIKLSNSLSKQILTDLSPMLLKMHELTFYASKNIQNIAKTLLPLL